MAEPLQEEGEIAGSVLVPTLRAVAVGMPSLLGQNRQGDVISAIRKSFISGDDVKVRTLNIDGDGQADLQNHGGVDKAIYCYPADHAAYWRGELGYGEDGTFAPFGENLSTLGVTEEGVCIGDVWRWGTALLQVSQPRWPCYKLVMLSGHNDMIKRFVASGRSGWYLRVLEPGIAPIDGPIEVAVRDPLEISVHLAFAVKTNGDDEVLAKVIAHPLLADAWRR